jgi:hypothetical protein
MDQNTKQQNNIHKVTEAWISTVCAGKEAGEN